MRKKKKNSFFVDLFCSSGSGLESRLSQSGVNFLTSPQSLNATKKIKMENTKIKNLNLVASIFAVGRVNTLR
jgi:hypothetical protein